MSRKSTVVVLTQSTPTQSYSFYPPINQVVGMEVDNISITGITSTGTSVVLASSNFASNLTDQQSRYGDIPLPIGWVQAYPIPPHNNQLPPIPIKLDAPRDMNNFLLTLTSNGTHTFAAFFAEWRITFFHE